ncbi:pseudouridine synthase [Chlorella sorokiniana]|uniref:Pseudouridine synthase n=1 Tax=Chlorella sorokiniana TaxID=3076 RepID=A0A2P6TU93_CHLSO|nr:pseudouridine synthase [Chlorella sorokiniana]|eukprot:PRW57629.1 pseudouridine synthase [Chlorella sorokiniana]
MAWLRRRGLPLPEAARQRLFRQGTVRLYDPATQRVGRVKKDRLLPPGAMLLLPKAAVAEAAAATDQTGSSSQRAADAAEQRWPAQQQARQAAVAELRGALLRNERDFIAINKPAGLATQGGRNVLLSVDDLMPDAFGGLPGVARPSDLRLVHRLDRQTTGVLLLAKSPDAAAWLSAAFRDDGSSSCTIGKTYWAVVAREGGGSDSSSSSGRAGQIMSSGSSSPSRQQRQGKRSGWLPPSGTVSLPVPSSRDPEQLQPAHTAFRVLQQSEGLAWLELRPTTGRKHQLRRHCAALGAPVLGDGRYGALRSPGQAAALADLQQHGSGVSDPPLLLHCRQLELRRPGGSKGGSQLKIAAPLPAAWRALLQQQGWPLPRDEGQ